MKTVNELIEDLILKEHNFFAYQQIQDLIERGTKRVGLVQATGTGKAFLAIQLLYDNCLMKDDKKILYITSSKPIIDQFDKHLMEVNIEKTRVFKNLDMCIYSSLLTKDFDLLEI